MSKHGNRYYLIIVCVILSLTATACFRDSAEGVGAQPVSELLDGGTSIAEAPTEVVIEETQEIVELPTETPTDEPTEVVLEVEETQELVVELPTETSTATSTTTPTSTQTPTLVIPTQTPTDDPLLLIQSQTPTSPPTLVIPSATADLPATQAALLQQGANATITIDPLFLRLTPSATPQGGVVNVGNTVPGGTAIAQEVTEEAPDNFSLTATALIGQLTEDAAAIATTQAFEAGIGVTPTLPPTATVDPLAQPTGLVPQGGDAIVPGADCVHQIRRGETLFKLSLAYGVLVSDMAAASGITNPNLVLIGRRVTIPGCGTTGFRPPATSVPVPTATIDPNTTAATGGVTAQGATTTGTTTTGTGTSSDTLAQAAQQEILNNAEVDIQANAIAQGAAVSPSGRTYTVQQGDTLFQIAQNFGTSLDALAILNGITNINQITMGDVLQIP